MFGLLVLAGRHVREAPEKLRCLRWRDLIKGAIKRFGVFINPDFTRGLNEALELCLIRDLAAWRLGGRLTPRLRLRCCHRTEALVALAPLYMAALGSVV
jgi:hypothetical protein